MALLSKACNLFSADGLPPEEPLRATTVEQAIHILHIHKCEVCGIGKRPGLMTAPRGLEKVQASITRKIDIIVRARGNDADTGG